MATTKSFVVKNGLDVTGNATVSGNVNASNGNLSGADATPTLVIQNTSSTTARFPQVNILNYTGGFGGAPVIELRAARGTAAAPASVQAGDVLGGFNTWGHNGTTTQSGTRIEGYAETTFSTAVSAGLDFYSTLAGVQNKKMRLSAAGRLLVGTTSDDGANTLQVVGTSAIGTGSVNKLVESGGATGIPPSIVARGETDIGLSLNSNGAGSIFLTTGGSAFTSQMRVSHTASAVDFVNVTGGNTIADISVQGSSTNATLRLTGKGTAGVHIVSGGAGPTTFYTGTTPAIQFRVADRAGSVNFVQFVGGPAGQRAILSVAGSDTNRGLAYDVAGNESHDMRVNGSSQLVISGPAAGYTNYMQVTGAPTGSAPTLSTGGSVDTNRSLNITSAGLGSVFLKANSSGSISFVASPSGASDVNYIQASGSATATAPRFDVAGTDTNIPLAMYTKGTSSMFFGTGGGTPQLRIDHTASAVNYMSITGGITGSAPKFIAQGSDATVPIIYQTKGDIHAFYTGAGIEQMRVNHIASAVNYLAVSGAATGGAVTLSTGGTDSNRSINITPTGTGTVNVTNLVTTSFARRSAASGVVAAGTTQGTATAITTDICAVGTATAGTAFGVILPGIVGAHIIVVNATAIAINVYPPIGGAIDAIATNTAFSLPAGGKIMFLSSSASQYYTLNATYA